MTTGTSHFESFAAALAYYENYGCRWADVQRKVNDKEIHLGPPKLKEGQRLTIHATERRYFITDES